MNNPQWNREGILHLLSVLDRRLIEKGESANVYIIGGAAMIVTEVSPQTRTTMDIDAVIEATPGFFDVVKEMAEDFGIPENWINDSGARWVPARPDTVPTGVPDEPGLHASYAPGNHLLAMKLISLRMKDSDDITDLARSLGIRSDDPDQLVDLVVGVFGDYLEQAIGHGGEGELRLRAMQVCEGLPQLPPDREDW